MFGGVSASTAPAAGEELEAALFAVWQRRIWIVVATDVGLRLARRPRFIGRGDDRSFDWRDLTAVSSGPQRVAMSFGGEDVSLSQSGRAAERSYEAPSRSNAGCACG
jgi:hypothetical protein